MLGRLVREFFASYCIGCRRVVRMGGLHKAGCFVAEREGLPMEQKVPGQRARGPAPLWALALAYVGILCLIGVLYMIWQYFT
ncbi:MAG: hypothetical protein AAFV27_08500 [Pseudomonadota bacterium]